jgi:cell wall-associated NlpC family hydrolase
MPSYRGIRASLCAVAVLLHGSGAVAAPDAAETPGDAVLQLLQERGLLSATAQGEANAAVHRVRDLASELVLAAMNFLGVPYKRGGDSAEEGFDCSGFTRHIFELSIGLVLPRRADQQAEQAGLLNVKRDELKPGDLVFFNTMRRAFSHVGIYVGDGKFIHAPRTGGEVRVEDMRQAYWVKRYNGARRAERVAAPGDAAAVQAGLPTGAPARPSGQGD